MLANVPKADLVVMNPTHFAVALKYEEREAMAAPRACWPRALTCWRFKIRDIAKSSTRSPCCRRRRWHVRCMPTAEVDQEIPVRLFTAVAQVLAYVYQLRACPGRPWRQDAGLICHPSRCRHDLDPANDPAFQAAAARRLAVTQA